MSRLTRRAIAVPVLVCLAVLSVACGSDDDDATSASTDAPSTAAPTSSEASAPETTAAPETTST